MWNLDSSDWAWVGNGGQMMRNIQTQIKSFSNYTKSWISLFHDAHSETAEFQDKMIKFIRSRHYEIVPLSECVNDKSPYFKDKPPF